MSVSAASLEAYWLPFTANRDFKKKPRVIVGAEGHWYVADDGRRLYDMFSGLWTSGLGHCHPKIVAAVQRQVAKLDYSLGFQAAHDRVFELAERVTALAPAGIDHIFFTNSGSESVDTALKIAIAYQRLRGEGTRQRLIGREKGYHGVGFGGISVGGMVNNRKFFGAMLPGVDHLRHTLDLEHNAFSRGIPNWGEHLADDLERLVALHDASTIAAVIVEPVAGSAGVVLPPKGYLQRLRSICDRHGILLIFDEVITGFGRLGAPFGADYFDVLPDIITTAKGLTNGAIPMGAVFVRKHIYDTFMNGPENAIELFHGYTYSAHPVACAAALATQKIYADEGLLTRGAKLAGQWEEAVHSLRGAPHVIDIRNLGLVAGIELRPREGAPGARAYEMLVKAFEKGILIRVTGDIIALSPPLIIEPAQIDELVTVIRELLNTVN